MWVVVPTLVMGGTAPGVLFLVTRRCSRFVPFRVRLDVGFLDFIIGCASVIRGIVMMGVSSITLCCLSRSTCCCSIITLCSSPSFGRLSILLMLVRSVLIISLPCGVLATFAVSSSISLAMDSDCSAYEFDVSTTTVVSLTGMACPLRAVAASVPRRGRRRAGRPTPRRSMPRRARARRAAS